VLLILLEIRIELPIVIISDDIPLAVRVHGTMQYLDRSGNSHPLDMQWWRFLTTMSSLAVNGNNCNGPEMGPIQC